MAKPILDIIIPAAGLGRRMKSYGPKALVHLGEETLIARQIRLLRECYPHSRIIVVAGFEASRLKASLPKDVRVVVNHEYATTNVSHSICVGLRHCRAYRPVLVVYGDLVFNREAIAGLPLDRSSVVVEMGDARREEVGVTVVGGEATRFSYGLPIKWAHICLLSADQKKLFLDVALATHRKRHFGYEILNEMLEQGGQFVALTSPLMRLVEIDCSKDIDLAMSLLTA